MTNKIVQKYWPKHILYKNQIPKTFSAIIRSKHAWKVYLKSFLVNFFHFLVKNGPKMEQKYFSQNFHWANIVKDRKCSFYKKNEQNPITGGSTTALVCDQSWGCCWFARYLKRHTYVNWVFWRWIKQKIQINQRINVTSQTS